MSYHSLCFNDKHGQGDKMRENILSIIVFMSLLFNILGAFVIYAQAKNNNQLVYDLNLSQTAFKIQQNEIAQGLCLKNLGDL